MRVLMTVPMLLLFAACNAEVDDANDSVTLDYDQNLAENTVEDVASGAENLAGQVANDVSESADRVQEEVGEADVDVDINRDNDKPAPTTNSQ